jgi:oxygen-independent coproporphyrinogen-3 oxidase
MALCRHGCAMTSDADLIARYDARVPRYTSYPTAPHFSGDVGPAAYADWLAAIPEGAELSLYVHVPFCDRLCLYCGCNTSVVRQERPKRAYAANLIKEIGLIAGLIGGRASVTHVHWGGGTPTALPADCMIAVMAQVRARFTLPANAEIAIEIDPTSLDGDALAALRAMGVTRASLGVQDFDLRVQEAIGRHQSFEETDEAATALRGLGIGSLNLDLIYGLPHQSPDSVRETALQALRLEADRIAVFGYAHVPWMKRHQALIPDDSLPGAESRLAQANVIRDVLETQGGYMAVGLDHFAKPTDSMAQAALSGGLHRSFQGYTTDGAPILIGLGASSIGTLPQGYVQNSPAVPAYNAAIEAGHLAAVKGVALSNDDKLRRAVIERIMCDLEVDLPALAAAFGAGAAPLLADAAGVARFVDDGLATWDGARVCVTERGRPFVRNIAALFDIYLRKAAATPRHAQAV